MMSSLLAIALMLVPSAASEPRKAYSACLVQFVRASAEKKLPPTEFDASVASACSNEEQAFRKSLMAQDKARGVSAKTSQDWTDTEVSDYLADAKERYRGEIENPQ